ncbi:TadE/TadG family type IV pilus assembly protein [Rhodalgimonas zhirmunskyi]|uniref:TadE/TadG family type IV pilus assembly protein n=1 Tax=Rhodalgimonas zhirmunskyi TaxID=2964767 RepID=UPI0029529508|nr:TadE/TadG family type IV pilus assembly protein [Rhodoalgimonas zhirmunskyi]
MRRFARDESGVMIAFSIFYFLIILLMVGVGVDLMRFEMERTKLQNTLDRAVLAAADLQQTQDPTDVVQDYFDKAHLNATLASPVVVDQLNRRTVTAQAESSIVTQFMHMVGINTLTAPALSQAEESIDGIEIVMVLDVSGSMGSNSRLVNLKPAAREFVDTVLDLAPAGEVTISIVPYNTQVNAGASLLARLPVTAEHSYSNCVVFDAADFDDPAFSSSGGNVQRAAHFDVDYTDGFNLPVDGSELRSPVCPRGSNSEILVMSDNQTALDAKINGLTAGGWTSIDLGMKWAAALVDPGSRTTINGLIADGVVTATNANRPVDYDEPNILKVIVVMTDGENTRQYLLRDDLRSGNSDVWHNDTTGTYSIWNAAQGRYFVVSGSGGSWRDHPFGDGAGESGSARRLEYPELYAANTVREVALNIYRPMYRNLYGYSAGNTLAQQDWITNAYSTMGEATKNTQLQQVCGALKDENVMIYSIGFEAPTGGQDELRDCATTPSHFFDVDGLEIRDAFQSIAASIAQLRLTQ